MLKGMTEFEDKVYNFIKEHGEILTSNIPPMMRGTIPNIKNKGFVEVYKGYATPFASKKKKFVRVIEQA